MSVLQQAEFLVIDLGNTAAKLRLARVGSLLGETRRVPTATLLSSAGPAALQDALAGWDFGRAILSSVVPDATRVIEGGVPPDKLLRVSPELDTGVDLRGYPGKATLGQDRIANMAGALARHGPGLLIVVDFGTAATFNALDAKGRFLGGVIAPGWTAVSGYLPSRAAQLPLRALRRSGSACHRPLYGRSPARGSPDRIPGAGAGNPPGAPHGTRRIRSGDRNGRRRTFPGEAGLAGG